MIGILNTERQRHSTPIAWLLLLWLTALLQIQQAACLAIIPESIRARRDYYPLAPGWTGFLNQKETTPESSGVDADASTNVRAAITSDDASNLSARDPITSEINPNQPYKTAPRPISKTSPKMAVTTPLVAPSPSYPFPPYRGTGSKPSPASSQSSHPPKGYSQQPPKPKGDSNSNSKPSDDYPPSDGAGGAGGDLFSTPITSDLSLPACLQTQPDHPAPRKGIKQSQEGAIPTNKFHANFFLGSQSSSVWTHPYSLQWPKGQGDSGAWGLAVSHVDASQRFFGEKDPNGSRAARWFASPVGRADVVLSEEELEKGNATGGVELTTQDVKEHSVRMQLSAGGGVRLEAPVVQGMGMVTALYKQGTPVIKSGIGWSMVTKAMGVMKTGVVKYRLVMHDGATWLLYATGGDVSAIKRGELGGLDLDVQGNNTAVAKGSFTGMLQLAKLPGGGNGTEGAADAEKLFDAACGTYATGVELSGSVDGQKGRYTFHFQKEGLASNSGLVMFALPHHQASFSSETASKVASSVKLDTTTKGVAVAVVGDEWTLEEDISKPLSIGFVPWTPEAGSVKDISDTAKEYIKNVAQQELLSTGMLNQTDQPSMYYGGKALAKFAAMLVAVNDVLGDTDLAKKGLEQLKVAFARYAENQQKYPLVYDESWGGIVSSASYTTGDSGSDFGNTYYNDHHFHYGYFIYTGAVLAHLDPSWASSSSNLQYVNSLVRDVANPSASLDPHFPAFRTFDWYHGHSWAHGLYESSDGKDQESSSEDSMHVYALLMWAQATDNQALYQRSALQLSLLRRSLNSYYLYSSSDPGSQIQPKEFTPNKVAGVLFENKIDHVTFFGNKKEYIQGIHMIPLLPHTMFIRDKEFVKEEWEQYFAGGGADQAEGGWKGVLYGNYATIDPKGAWEVFAGAGVPSGGSQPADPAPAPGNGTGNGTSTVEPTLIPTSTSTSTVSTPGLTTLTPTATPTSTSVPTIPVPGVPDSGNGTTNGTVSAMTSKMARRTIRRALEKGKMKMPSVRASVPKAKRGGFSAENLDGGASLTWYLTWCAALGGL
ncbi:glycosyl hydrolase family 81-domain-containing protein [Pseudoneurospora amorphoporcata]|uniref:glucan endo-1,3-beta-D-glucosidase n=1 Tax=Pseudoneurospora amorphoporcata TaxID=241081 RepID=A0AAN6NP39_9PEZI|nr:glycosyl hydrolase family 81-domain-containing protein [Pseudoneurospora amorphoporcata]